MYKKVLLTEQIRPIGIAELKKQATEVIIAPNPQKDTIIAMATDVDGIISRTTRIDEDIFSRAPKLKVVASHGTGTDHIDVEAATRHGVCVVNTPGANSESVAEMVVGLMLCLSRKIIVGDAAMRINKDYSFRKQCIGLDLYKKTLSIIGLGAIGQKLARICGCGFKMNILGYDPLLTKDQMSELGIEKIDEIDDVLKKADYVSLNCPYFDSTYHMINARRLSLMKPDSFLINCARGQLVDENALYIALKNATLAGAAIDVYSTEPPDINNPLFTLPNIIATPHIACNAQDSIDNMSLISAIDVVAVLAGQPEKAHVVNKAALG